MSGGSTEPRFIQVSLKREPGNSKFCKTEHQMVVLIAAWIIFSVLCKGNPFKRVENPEAMRVVMRDISG